MRCDEFLRRSSLVCLCALGKRFFFPLRRDIALRGLIQKILKLRLGKAEKEAQEKEDAPEKPGTKNGNNSRNRGLSIQRDF